MHREAWAYVARVARDDMTARHVVEIGSRNVNGSVRGLFSGSYIGVDVAAGPSVDVVADGADYDPGRLVDVCLCLETLEHAPNVTAVLANMARMTRPGGLIVVTAATDPRPPHSGRDGGPLPAGEYYGNVSPALLCDWLAATCETWALEVDRPLGDVRAWGRRCAR